MADLGLQEWQSGWRIKGDLTLQEALDLSKNLIAFVGMEAFEAPDVKYFNGIKGGVGFQFYQTLVESWLIISTWPKHGFFRVNLSSCKYFSHGAVTVFLERLFGAESVLITWQLPL